MAFGTGTHETTRMCIQSLEKYVKEDSTVFDVGCGSGILAIAAAKLGSKMAVGVDLDPVAVESAKENVGYNNLENIQILYGGILAIAAAKLGSKMAVGVDLDPVAVESAKENVGYNNLENIQILYGNLVEVIDGKADIVVANIIAEVICILTEDVKRVLKDNGYFITSGIIHDRVDMVTKKLEETGFEVIEINKDGEWNCIVAKVK